MTIVPPIRFALFVVAVLVAGQIKSSAAYINRPLNSTCQTPDRQTGTCIPLRSCDTLFELLLKQPLYQDDRDFLRQSQCGYNDQPLVCCPPATNKGINSNLLPKPSVCGAQISDRLFGGEFVAIDGFPWTALVQYSKPNDTKRFHCGGVLISERYVLTAAQCLSHPRLRQLGWEPIRVRLGEWDTDIDPDCDYDDCADPVIDVPFEEIIVHESYDPDSSNKENDIALIRLARPIAFTEFVKPICLPTGGVRLDGNRLFLSGWGYTETGKLSNKKLQTQVQGVDMTECNLVYGQIGVRLGAGQMCAGGETGKDSCRGDSGGALMAVSAGSPYWYCAGIVSLGRTQCGLGGWPGIYTNVTAYMDWIVGHLRE